MEDPTAHDLSWMNDVKEKIIDVFHDQPEDLCRIFYFLDEEDKAYKYNPFRPYAPQWNSLKLTMDNDRAFRVLSQLLSDDTKKAMRDQEFRCRMRKVYENMLEHSD